MNSGTRRGETQTELSQNENEDHTQRFKVLSESIAAVKKVILTPGPFLGCATDIKVDEKKNRLKSIFDGTFISTESKVSELVARPLTELLISGFDSEQIWQQLVYTHDNISSNVTDVSQFLTNKLSLSSHPGGQTDMMEDLTENDSFIADLDSDTSEKEEDGVNSSSEYSDAVESPEEEENESVANQAGDKFFSMKKMESVLDKQDADLLKDPENFERMPEMYETDEGSDSEEHQYKYSDFFDAVGSKSKVSSTGAFERPPRNPLGDMSSDEDEDESENMSDEELQLIKALDEETMEGEGSEEEEESENEPEEANADEDDVDMSDDEHLEDVIGKQKHEPSKSQYETRKEKLAARIKAMEDKALSDQPWQLKGEVTARSRPENSLIQEAVEFDSNVAPVPTITMETTQSLEAIIIQRIKDKSFDDVERKVRLKDDSEKFKKRIELDHEKSKMSLSAIYEQEYIKLRDKEGDAEEKIDPAEEEIQKMMSSLFSKLDALSSFQYTPKPAPKEVKVISHLPSVVVEEVQPDTVADSARLAPEEIKRPRVEVKDRSEMDSTDKKRMRRRKKAKNRKVEMVKKTAEARVQKLNPGLGNKRAEQRSIEAIKQAVVNEGKVIRPSKESVLPDKTYSSSKEFFKALQNEVKLDKSRPKKKLESKKLGSAKPVEKLKL